MKYIGAKFFSMAAICMLVLTAYKYTHANLKPALEKASESLDNGSWAVAEITPEHPLLNESKGWNAEWIVSSDKEYVGKVHILIWLTQPLDNDYSYNFAVHINHGLRDDEVFQYSKNTALESGGLVICKIKPPATSKDFLDSVVYFHRF